MEMDRQKNSGAPCLSKFQGYACALKPGRLHEGGDHNNATGRHHHPDVGFWETSESDKVEMRPAPKRPRVVCLCGSTRFKAAFDDANYAETMAGKIVLSVGFFMHATGNQHGGHIGCTPEQKVALDELHKRKIDLADEVLVLNVGGYIGESTRSEISHAEATGKPVRYLELVAEKDAGRE